MISVQKLEGLTTFGRSICLLTKSFVYRYLSLVLDDQFSQAGSGQGHWLLHPTQTVTSKQDGTKIQDYSYNFDPITGNLNWRQNNKYSNLREDFYYDNLDRLDYIQMNGTTTLDMAYDSNKGGIATKNDVGRIDNVLFFSTKVEKF